MTKIRKCGTGWSYCDGKCYTCGTNFVTTTGETKVIQYTVPAPQMETVYYPQISGITPYVIEEGEQDGCTE